MDEDKVLNEFSVANRISINAANSAECPQKKKSSAEIRPLPDGRKLISKNLSSLIIVVGRAKNVFFRSTTSEASETSETISIFADLFLENL